MVKILETILCEELGVFSPGEEKLIGVVIAIFRYLKDCAAATSTSDAASVH